MRILNENVITEKLRAFIAEDLPPKQNIQQSEQLNWLLAFRDSSDLFQKECGYCAPTELIFTEHNKKKRLPAKIEKIINEAQKICKKIYIGNLIKTFLNLESIIEKLLVFLNDAETAVENKGIVLNTIGSCQVYLRKFDDALSSFKQCQELLKECLDDQLYAACLNNRALIYMKMQENEEAKKLLEEAAKKAKTLSVNEESLIECHLHMLKGAIAIENGDYALSLSCYSKVHEICGVLDVNIKTHLRLSCIQSLHNAAIQSGRNQDIMLGEMEKISAEVKNSHIPDSRDKCFVLARNCYFIGSLLRKMEKHSKSNEVLQEGLDRIKKEFSSDDEHTHIHVLILIMIAKNFEHNFQYNDAIKYENMALEIVHKIVDVNPESKTAIENSTQLHHNGTNLRNEALKYAQNDVWDKWAETMQQTLTINDDNVLLYNMVQFWKNLRHCSTLECHESSSRDNDMLALKKCFNDIEASFQSKDLPAFKAMLRVWYNDMANFFKWVGDYPQSFLYSKKVVEAIQQIPEQSRSTRENQAHASQLLLQGFVLFITNQFKASLDVIKQSENILHKLADESFAYQIYLWNCQIFKLIARAGELRHPNDLYVIVVNSVQIMNTILQHPCHLGNLFVHIETLIKTEDISTIPEIANAITDILKDIASTSTSLIKADHDEMNALYTMYLESQRCLALSYASAQKFGSSLKHNKTAVKKAEMWYGKEEASNDDVYRACLNNIGQNYYNLRQYEKAIEWYQKAFEAIRCSEKFDETFESRIEDAHGKLCQDSGKLQGAFQHYSKVYEIMQKSSFKNKRIGSLLNFMLSCKSLVFTNQKKFNRSVVIKKMRDLLSILLRKSIDDPYWNIHSDISWAWHVLGECYNHIGEHKNAEKARKNSSINSSKFQDLLQLSFFLGAAFLWQAIIGPDVEDFSATVDTLVQQGNEVWKQNKKDESLKYFHQLADLIRDENVGADNYAIDVCVRSLFKKASKCISSDKDEERDFAKQKIMPLLERILSENTKDKFTHKFFMIFGECYLNLGNKAKSKHHLILANDLLFTQKNLIEEEEYTSDLSKISTYLSTLDAIQSPSEVQTDISSGCAELKLKNKEVKEHDILCIIDTVKSDTLQTVNEIRFQSCEFVENVLDFFLKHLINKCNIRKIRLLEISDAKKLNEIHAKALGSFLCSVHVETLDVHGSNLKQFANSVFKPALIKAPKEFETRIVFEIDEVKFIANSSGTTKDFGFSGSRIIVPPGALEEETEISLLVLPEMTKLPDGLIQVTPIVRCFPTGLKFNKPVTINLSTWCHATQKSTELTVFTREDANEEEWKEECRVQYNNEKFIQFQTSHFSDDVVAASHDEVFLDYQVLVYRKKYAEFNDDQSISIYCLPDDNDLFNKINKRCQAEGSYSCFAGILLKGKPNQTKISIEITSMNCEIENGFKEFSCADLNVDSMHTCAVIYDDGSRESKENGIRLNFKLEVDGELKKDQSFKVHWKTPPNHNLDNIREINNVYNAHVYVDKAKTVVVGNNSPLSGSSNINSAVRTSAITETRDSDLQAIKPNVDVRTEDNSEDESLQENTAAAVD